MQENVLDNKISVFRRIGIGQAAENKKLKSSKLTITTTEKLPFIDGETVERVDAVEFEGKDFEGKTTSGQSFVSNNLVAEWLPSGNRRTAPDVQRGERVEIYQYANNDKYYWRCLNLDENLRRLETVVIGINANPAMGQDGVDPDNMYFIELSSHSKTITLSTSQKNGEICTYDLQLDMATGKVVLQDNIGNYSLLDSPGFKFEWKNALGTFFKLDKQDIYGYAPRNINFTAGANVDVKANKITLNGGGSIFTLEAPGTTLVTPSFKGSTGGG